MLSKKFYLQTFSICGIGLLLSLPVFYYKNNTDGIRVSKNYSLLECATSIQLHASKNIEDFYNTAFSNASLEEQICTMDTVFDGSSEDRIHLVGFSEQKLEFSFVSRHDIAQYFYRKALNAAPNDSLSQYIHAEKIKN